MKPDTFVKLALATIVTSLLALLVHSSGNRWSQGTVAGTKLAPTLASGRAQVASITITQGSNSLTLEGKDKAWTIKERAAYPADADKARALLVKLAQAELIEAKTKKPDRYAMIELEDPKGKDAKSRAIRLADAKGGVIAEVIAGKRKFEAFGTGRSGTYVRLPGDPQSWLASAEIDASVDVRAWIKPAILEIDEGKITAVTIELPGEEALKIERGEAAGAKAAFAGLPESKKLKDASAAEGVLRAIASIEADDVRKLAVAPSAEGGVGTVRVVTRDGLDLALRIRKDADGTWLSVAPEAKSDVAKPAAEPIKARTSGWEFKIPATKTDALLKRRADLFEAS